MQNNNFDYPKDEPILLVRPCLIVICRDNRPAAKLLSGLLYHARNCPEEQETFIFQRKQEELVKRDLCGEISVKTLHDVAIPALKLLGFIEVDESSYVMRYTIYLSRVRQALAAYKKGKEPLEKVLIDFIKRQLEKVLIELEKVLIDKKNFQLLLEKFLIVIRKVSNCRGRKTNGQATAEAPEIDRDNRDSNRDNREVTEADASQPHAPLSQDEIEEKPYAPDYGSQEKPDTVDAQQKTIRIVKSTIQESQSMGIPAQAQGYTQAGELSTLTIPQQGGNHAYRSTDSSVGNTDARDNHAQRGAGHSTTPGTPAAHGKNQSAERRAQTRLVTPSLFGSSTPARPQLTETGEDVRSWYATIRATKVRKTNENINACNGLAECDGISFENLKAAIEHWEADDFVKARGIVVDLQKLEKSGGPFSFEKAMIAIQQKAARGKGKKQAKSEEYDPYSLAGLLAEQNPGFFESSY